MDVISQNIANINTTRSAEGGPYQRRAAIFEEIGFESALDDAFAIADSTLAGPSRLAARRPLRQGGVRVAEIAKDSLPGPKVHEPGHPDADEDGYVSMPNVNIVEEMVDMISASRSYEANVTAIANTKAMIAKTMEISR
jgi:flagellar basal-body rod protein FlgC